jgi:thymidylate synthase
LTTKKVAFKTMATELLWFLRGDTNIKYLVDNGCHIWNGDAYKNFYKKSLEIKLAYESGDLLGGQPHIDAMFSNSNELIILTEEEFINKIKTDDGFARRFGELGPIYGKQWRNWVYDKDMDYGTEESVDQIQNLINDLKTNPDSRRLMVSAWNVGEIQDMVLPPCHYAFQVYTRELSLDERRVLVSQEMFNQIYNSGDSSTLSHSEINQWNVPTRSISLSWNQRSVDTFLGLPFNIASYGLLLTMLADEVNMVPDQLIGNLGDTHIYLNHIEQAKEQIGREYTEEEILEHLQQSGMDALVYEARMEYISKLPKRTREPYPLPTVHVRDGIFCSSVNDIILENYQSHPVIKAPLSN